MKISRRLLAAAVATTLAASPAAAGMLDLDIYGKPAPSALESAGPAWRQSRDYVPKELWLPGSPLNTQGAGPLERSIAFTGNAALGGWGIAQSWSGMRHNKGEEAAAIGFGLITAWNVLELFQLLSGSDEQSEK